MRQLQPDVDRPATLSPALFSLASRVFGAYSVEDDFCRASTNYLYDPFVLRFLQDTTNSGAVTKAMMLDYASKKGITQYSKEQLKEYFDLLDKNNTGTLDKSEFSALFEVLQANADESEGLETDLRVKGLDS